MSKQRGDSYGGVSRSTEVSPLRYTMNSSLQIQTRVKLNRVFFPR